MSAINCASTSLPDCGSRQVEGQQYGMQIEEGTQGNRAMTLAEPKLHFDVSTVLKRVLRRVLITDADAFRSGF